MDKSDRKAALDAYRERKAVAGIYAVRCAATGECWVGATRDIEKIWNRVAFSLRSGASPHRRMQAAWNAQGAASFSFEALERLEAEALEFARDKAMAERAADWRTRLAATGI